MSARPKDIGTASETAVRNALIGLGYDERSVQRHVLKGAHDEGDIWLETDDGLIIFEVKGGAMAKNASVGQVTKWMKETVEETANARAMYGFLVTQRAGVGLPRAHEWPAHVMLSDLARILGTTASATSPIQRVTMPLWLLVKAIRGEG